MGMYDTYDGMQMKVGPRILSTYEIGDEVPIDDGIYYSPNEGFIVIHDGTLIMSPEFLTDKWGNELLANMLVDNNPVKKAVDELVDIYTEDTELTVFTDLDSEDFMEEIDA